VSSWFNIGHRACSGYSYIVWAHRSLPSRVLQHLVLDSVYSSSIVAVRSAQASTADEYTCTFAHAVMLCAVSVLYVLLLLCVRNAPLMQPYAAAAATVLHTSCPNLAIVLAAIFLLNL
jgi:hypothetical protein